MRGLAAEGQSRGHRRTAGSCRLVEPIAAAGGTGDRRPARAHPEQAGLSLNDLRSALEASLILPEVFEALLTDLCGQEFQQVNAVIRRRTHRPALPPQFQAAGAKLRAALSAKLFEPPSRKDLAPDAVSQRRCASCWRRAKRWKSAMRLCSWQRVLRARPRRSRNSSSTTVRRRSANSARRWGRAAASWCLCWRSWTAKASRGGKGTSGAAGKG